MPGRNHAEPWHGYVLSEAYFRNLLADACHALEEHDAAIEAVTRASEIFEQSACPGTNSGSK